MKQHIRIDMVEPNQGVLDFSHLLDAPAGKHGFVRVKDGHLYYENGQRARFLGFNIAARSNTPSHEDAEKLAKRFASMGVNVIRLHAADCPINDEPGTWASCREAPLLDYDKGSSRLFNPEGLDRFDYLVAKLKEKGIYLHIDLIVARTFLEEDGLDYPGCVPSCMKRHPMYNQRLIELQKEYARELLCHVNPYTGLALVDDPAVMTVQMNNEESAIKGNMGADQGDEMKPYRDEVQRRFGNYLLMKYHTRERLKEAWSNDGVCALGDEEDPAGGTMRGIEGGFYQSVNEPMGPWDAAEGPARYADFMEFGILMNRRFYQDMKDYLVSLGVKVPIVASNLMAGAADVYGHTDGDLMENNAYFNHPILPVQNDTYMVVGPMEYVSANPLVMQQGVGAMATTLLSLASVAIVEGKPFMLSEWNEYGLHVLHIGAMVSPAADHDPEKTLYTNIGSTLAIIQAIKEQPNADDIRFAYVGTVAETGDRQYPVQMGRCGDPINPSVHDYYAISKVFSEFEVFESGLKHWVSIRQTGQYPSAEGAGEEPIIFHQPPNNVLEWSTSIESGICMANLCEDWVPESFWRKAYNLSSGKGWRLTCWELTNICLEGMGLTFADTEDPRRMAQYNFHGHYFSDADELDNILHFRCIDPKVYQQGIVDSMKAMMSNPMIAAMIPGAEAMKAHNVEIGHKRMGYDWMMENNETNWINAFFGSRAEAEALPSLEEGYKLFHPSEEEKKLDHGYDETKPFESLDIEDMKQAAAFRGGEVLSDKVESVYEPIEWKCAFGHTFRATPNTVLHGGHWCPECQRSEWHYAEIARKDPFYAQVWTPIHGDKHDYHIPMAYSAWEITRKLKDELAKSAEETKESSDN